MNYKLALILAVSFVSFISSNGEKKTNPPPVVRAIHMENGDIFDCIDIKLQPAFQHPLLQNHTIQMRPNFNLITKVTEESPSQSNNLEISCPDGTIPIWRNQKQNASSPQSFNLFKNLFGKIKSRKIQFQADVTELPTAMYGIVGKFKGTKADINVWEPKVHISGARYSTAVASVLSGRERSPEYIAAGWTVWPKLFSDDHSRLYITWRDNSPFYRECVNHFCPGFVQIAKDVFLGAKIPASVYSGEQRHISIQIQQDNKTGNWWLVYQEKYVGYWPESLFSRIGKGDVLLAWGGAVESADEETTMNPQMGSGHFPWEGRRKAAYVDTLVIDEKYHLAPPNLKNLWQFENKPRFYQVTKPIGGKGLLFFFGGPGHDPSYES